MRINLLLLVVLAGFVAGNSVFLRAQPESVPYGATMIAPPDILTAQTGGDVFGFQFVSGGPGISTDMRHLVKGSPFSLEAAIETVQTLSDGNRIIHRQSVHLYRDSKGRTRREETLAAIGPWAASGTPPTMITIQDPVTGASYFLDPQRKVAGKLPLPPAGKDVIVTRDAASVSVGPGSMAGNDVSGEEGHVLVMGFDGARGEGLRTEERSESLGKESVAGVTADGTRTTTTIPADAIGNERPLDIVRERWYSPDLQIVLRSKQADPRFGETNYEVTKLDRAEPSPSLFELPADYKVKEGATRTFIRQAPSPK